MRSNCSEFLAENLGRRKLEDTESYPPNLRAADSSPKMQAGLILHSKRDICPSENNTGIVSLHVTKI